MSEKKKGYLGQVFNKFSSKNAVLNKSVLDLYKEVYTFKDSNASDSFGGGKAGKVGAALYMTVTTPVVPIVYMLMTAEDAVKSASEVKAERKKAEKERKKDNYDIM